MNIMSRLCFERSFTAALCLFLMLSLINTAFCNEKKDKSDRAKQSAKKADDPSKKDNGKPEEIKNFPFAEGTGKISDDGVAGLRIVRDKLILLGYDKNCTSEALKSDETFSNLNFFKKYSKLVSVEFANIELTKECLENIQKFLQKEIQNIVIDSCEIESSNVELLADIVKKRPELKNVTFRMVENNENDVETILSALGELSKLKTICLAFDKIKNESCQKIAELIKKSADSLKNLSLAWNGVVEADKESEAYQKLSEAIGEVKGLKSFELFLMSIDEKNTANLFSGIRHLTTLSRFKLFLGNISIQNDIKLFENAESLGDTLKDMTQLVKLDISGMKLPKDVMQVLAQNLEYLKKLQYLDISGNTIDGECAEILVQSLKGMNELKTLAINGCELTSQVFSTLCKLLENSPLIMLYARNNAIKEGVRSLPVKTMTDLQLADFSKNDVTFENAMELIKLTVDHPKLQAINFRENEPLDSMDEVDKKTKRDELENWKRANKCHVAFFGL
ncbi:hypothetical protein FACS189449_02680 [Alphaproteobacteria bacterium]|nr:hypothetical protein FACS189449_02680 [Alphaproteobacteria bacterium]